MPPVRGNCFVILSNLSAGQGENNNKIQKKFFKKSEKPCLLYVKIIFITLAFKRKYEIPVKLCENFWGGLL